MPTGRTGAVNHAVKPYMAEEKAWLAAPQLSLAQSVRFCRPGITDKTLAWIKLTEPGGNPKAQLDLASGKLQGVQENVDQVMQLIMATAGALANDECA